MKRLLCLLIAIVIASPLFAATVFTDRAAWLAALDGAPTTLNFEGIAPAGNFAPFYGGTTIDGTVFGPQGAGYLIVISSSYLAGTYGYDYGSGDSMQVGQSAEGLRITLPGFFNAFSVDLFAVNPDDSPVAQTVSLQLGAAAGSVNTLSTQNSVFFGIVADAPFSTVDIAGNLPGTYINLDNVSYGSVPEPGTSVVAGLGIGLIALVRRFRK